MASGFNDIRPWESNDTALEQLAQPSPRIEKMWTLREPMVEKLAEAGFEKRGAENVPSDSPPRPGR